MGHLHLDHQATTPCRARVVSAMMRWFGPFSRDEATRAVSVARDRVAARVGASGFDVTFTSGATEANALAIEGTVRAAGGGHVVTVATEHVSVLRTVRRAADSMTVLPVGPDGRVSAQAVRQALQPQTVLVSVMAVNNEIGVTHDLEAIAAVCQEAGVPLHVDAAQLAFGCLDASAGIDLVSVSGHKIGGPQGIGALVVRPGHPLAPLWVGGPQQAGLRAGTVPVALAVGLGVAAGIVDDGARIAALRDLLAELLIDRFDGARWNGSRQHRAPHNLSLILPGIDTALLVDEVAEHLQVSTGSACSSGSPGPSHVIRALGVRGQDLHSVLRVGLSFDTTEAQIRRAADLLADTADRQRMVPAR